MDMNSYNENNDYELNECLQNLLYEHSEELYEWFSQPLHVSTSRMDVLNSALENFFAKDALIRIFNGTKEEKIAAAVELIIAFVDPQYYKEHGVPDFAEGIIDEDILFVRDQNELYTLEIPPHITDFCVFKFYDPSMKLQEIIFPAGAKEICGQGGSPFEGLENLEKVVLPDGIEEIGEAAFCECCNLEDINLPSTIKKIGQSAFALCPKLKVEQLPSSLTYIGAAAFSGCLSLKELILPANEMTIEDEAFFGCDNIKKVVISAPIEVVMKICVYVIFDDNNNIETLVYNGCQNINGLFEGLHCLKWVELSSETKVIESGAFYEAIALEQLVLPDGVVSIENGAFAGCKKLKSVIVPDSIEHIDENAFVDCESIKIIYKDSIYSYSDIPTLCSIINA